MSKFHHENYQPEMQKFSFNLPHVELLDIINIGKLGMKFWKEEVTRKKSN